MTKIQMTKTKRNRNTAYNDALVLDLVLLGDNPILHFL